MKMGLWGAYEPDWLITVSVDIYNIKESWKSKNCLEVEGSRRVVPETALYINSNLFAEPQTQQAENLPCTRSDSVTEHREKDCIFILPLYLYQSSCI